MRLLQRYVLLELLAVSLFALLSLTLLLMFFGVIYEARKAGFGPAQILMIIPYLIPGTLPYTVPATTLFAVTMVYGRMSGSGEVTAIKAAGSSVTTVLWPALLLGSALSVGTLFLADRFVPWARAGIRTTVLATLEDVLYDVLRHQRHFHDEKLNVTVTVQEVVGRRLINPLFIYRLSEGTEVGAMADEATLRINTHEGLIHIQMKNANVTTSSGANLYWEHFEHSIPLPGADQPIRTKPQDYTISQMYARIRALRREADEMATRRAVAAVFQVMRGRPTALLRLEEERQPQTRSRLQREIRKFRTELHSRRALSFSCLFFVWLGAPVAIWGARRDFLGNFWICFAPILVVYYPVAIMCMNLGKEGKLIDPAYGMWTGNAILACVGWWVLRRVLRH
jgi:lipopolysaccharide export system permease protein